MHTRQTERFVYARGFIVDVLAAYDVVPLAALIAAPKVRLFQGPTFHPTWQTALADFTANIADFTDYVEKTPVFAGPAAIAGQGLANQSVVSWLMTTDPAVTQNTVRGYYVVDGAQLVGFEEWDVANEVGMAAFGDSLVLELLLPFLHTHDLGAA